MSLALLASAAVTGLLGGFGHCAGMCGPLVASVSLALAPQGRPVSALAVHGLYNAGRITTYAFIGGVMGLVGSFVNVATRLTGLQNGVSVLAGLLMLLMGLGAAGVAPGLRGLEQKLAAGLLGRVRGLLDASGQGRAYALGLVLGLLPCGLSYSAFVGAAATGHPVHGALFALAFGLGTAPALLVIGGLASTLSVRLRGILYRLGGFAVALVGLLFVLRGLGLVHAL